VSTTINPPAITREQFDALSPAEKSGGEFIPTAPEPVQ
jgi:hypothetical protein